MIRIRSRHAGNHYGGIESSDTKTGGRSGAFRFATLMKGEFQNIAADLKRVL